ncbi:MAG TPA: pyruvate, phosphate dikinase [Clostridiales bacterium]|nr:pyruvate, phosphate dikinase [Clostridiales bacterium]
MSGKYVYRFGDGRADMRDLLGGKGANLAEMVRLGLPVPPGFIISTQACRDYYRLGRNWPGSLEEQVAEALAALEGECGRPLGSAEDPLLVSVRSGGAASMPGMMDTILNLGLNPESAEGMGRSSGSAIFALDCYRRFLQMFGDVVMGIPHRRFEDVLETARRRRNAPEHGQWDEETLRGVVQQYLKLVADHTGDPFPVSPRRQLWMAIRAVFDSWNNQRAIAYREMYGIPHDLGTAVTVQSMVFGNRGPRSATGVVFSRDPSTGARRLYGEYLLNAQGEDVVAGIRTPRPIADMAGELPDAHAQLERYARLLEGHYRDMQDIEFTVEEDRLYILQTRSGKRSVAASIRAAVDLAEEGVIDREAALLRVEPEALARLLHPTIDSRAALDVLATGLPASPGAATGSIALDADSAQARAEAGERVLLVRPETTPDDIHGIAAAQGVLTARGGMTCHAAIVARGMGKPCVVGCDAIRFDPRGDSVQIGDRVLRAGDILSIDGATGRVVLGEVPLVQPDLSPYFRTLLAWADGARRLGVRANADTPADAARAREFGAEGIGLCRTEHMFMAQDRLPIVQAMILAETERERRGHLERLLPIQRADFAGILEAMAGLPVTIRLLDPPLHEFLPNLEELGAAALGSAPTAREHQLLQRARALRESNPMLGHRGVRLGISHPEIYEMQVRAIFEATADLVSRGVDARPEIMIPLVGLDRELAFCHELIARVAAEVAAARGMSLACPVGTMIEIPRACVVAGVIAGQAEFFSFGTNDLTQTTFGFSRDDAEAKFLTRYLDSRILTANPFVTLDRDGVGRLVEMAVEGGRRARPDLKIGICGEHGGDPASISFFHQAGLDYVSCSPFRVPIARLAAAQAALSASRPASDAPSST